MAFFNVFPLGSLPVTDELRATCRAVSSACDDAAFLSLMHSLAESAVVCAGAGVGASKNTQGEAQTHAAALAALSQLGSSSARAAAADALTALLVDFVKCNTAVDALPPALEEFGFSPTKSAVFANVYSANFRALRLAAENSGELPSAACEISARRGEKARSRYSAERRTPAKGALALRAPIAKCREHKLLRSEWRSIALIGETRRRTIKPVAGNSTRSGRRSFGKSGVSARATALGAFGA